MILNGVEVEEESFAEMFPMWVGRFLITAINEKWANTAAENAVSFATTTIGCPVEGGIERDIPASETPDGKPGVAVQMYLHDWRALKKQIVERIRECVMPCPTTAVFDFLPGATRRIKVGRSLRLFGDGYQKRGEMFGRTVWRIPVTEGEFIVEETLGVKKAVAGGMFLIFARNQKAGLSAAEKASDAIRTIEDVILTFPGGICRSGSKVGSAKYPRMKASTNEPYCPTLKGKVTNTMIPKNVESVYELVFNGLTLESIKRAMAAGIKEACSVEEIVRIKAANYGGTLGPIKLYIKEALC